jgi:hypothetical protein
VNAPTVMAATTIAAMKDGVVADWVSLPVFMMAKWERGIREVDVKVWYEISRVWNVSQANKQREARKSILIRRVCVLKDATYSMFDKQHPITAVYKPLLDVDGM